MGNGYSILIFIISKISEENINDALSSNIEVDFASLYSYNHLEFYIWREREN